MMLSSCLPTSNADAFAITGTDYKTVPVIDSTKMSYMLEFVAKTYHERILKAVKIKYASAQGVLEIY